MSEISNTPLDSTAARQQVSILRKFLTDPQCDPEVASKEWVQQAEQAEIHNHRMELKLLLGLLDRIAFPLPLKLQAYQIYYQGFLHELDSDYTKARDYYQPGLELVQEQAELSLLKGLFNRGLGHCLVQRGESELAEPLLQTALTIAQAEQHRLSIGASSRTLGYCYYKMGQMQKGIEYCLQAIKIAQEIGNISGEAATYSTLGLCYITTDRLEEGRQALERAAFLRNSLGNNRDLGNIYLNLGLIHDKLGDYKAASESAQLAITLCNQVNNQQLKGLASLNLTLYLVELKEFDKALEAATQAVQIFQELGDQHFLLAALTNKAIAYGRANQLQPARDFLSQAEELLEMVKLKKNYAVLAGLYQNLNMAALQIAESEEEFAKAFGYREASLMLFEQHHDHYSLASSYEQEARILVKSLHYGKYKEVALQDMQKWLLTIQTIAGFDYSKVVDTLLFYADLLNEHGRLEQSFEVYNLAFNHLNATRSKIDKRKLVNCYTKAAKLATPDKAIPLIEQAINLLKADHSEAGRVKELVNEISLLRKQQPKTGKWVFGKH